MRSRWLSRITAAIYIIDLLGIIATLCFVFFNDCEYGFELRFVIVFIYFFIFLSLYLIAIKFINLRNYSWLVIRKSLIRCLGILLVICISKYLFKYGLEPIKASKLDFLFFSGPLGKATAYLFVDAAVQRSRTG
ncbi:hypothetical protein [Paenibacillus sp. YAF4_2]|uniref:hypothetical protein n=1 Tax=Paenibacillus sp. YAF4_2 TaxID=3233085 RepID=UPI003F9CBB3C